MPTLALTEVEITGGSAHATSVYPESKAEYAFSDKSHWHLGRDSPGKYSRFPVLVWYEFPEEKLFVPGRVSFRGRQDSTLTVVQQQTPSEWQFVGSNDQSCGKFGTWTVLCEDRSNAVP